MSEAKLSAFLVAALVCVGLTLTLSTALRDVWFALSIAAPASLILGVAMALFASDAVKTGGETPQNTKSKGKRHET